ncbi:MAG: VanW family protein [Clostridia bacterium]|nr:VanW family protein [Clostridia bacterium]
MLRTLRRIPAATYVIIAVVLFMLIYAIRFASIVGVGTPRFVSNVTVDDTSFSGLTHEQGLARAAQLEQEWLSESFVFTYRDQSWVFTRSMVNADIDLESSVNQAWNFGHVGNIFQRKNNIEWLASHPVHLVSTVTYDQALADAFMDGICSAIDVEAVDAVVVADVDKPIVLTESSTGLRVNREQLQSQLDQLIRSNEADTILPVETVFPAVTSDEMSCEVIAQFSTDVSFRNSSSRSNVRLALSNFNGLAVSPGQAISFNGIVGPRDKEHGYKQATEYAGDTTTLGWGGGVCQASTTLYNALIMADMTIVDRSSHTMTVSYVDPSCDAAVSYPSKDLKFINETDSTIYIYTAVTDKRASVTIYGKKPEYFQHLESVLVQKKIKSTRELDIQDTTGQYAFFTDERVLQSKGKDGCISQGWIVSYDWNTRQEVSRVQISQDSYRPGASVYYVGIHDRSMSIAG